MDTRFKHPFTMIISGPTGSGKTVFTFKLLQDAVKLITPPPERIVYCYGEYQTTFNEFPHIEFREGLPQMGEFDGNTRVLLVLDDLMAESDESVSNIFTKFSHHRNISIIYLTQNLFYKSRHNRTMNLNAHYIVLFKNPRDSLQVATLARQMYPGNSKFLIEAFNDATKLPYGYLLIDLKADTDERLRVRTHVLSDLLQYVYVRKV